MYRGSRKSRISTVRTTSVTSTICLVRRRKMICQYFVSYVAFVKSVNGRNSQPETFPHRIVFMGMMSEIDIDRHTQKAEEHSRGDRGIVGWTERFRPGQLLFLFVACYVQNSSRSLEQAVQECFKCVQVSRTHRDL